MPLVFGSEPLKFKEAARADRLLTGSITYHQIIVCSLTHSNFRLARRDVFVEWVQNPGR
jgi:hypothetical protein